MGRLKRKSPSQGTHFKAPESSDPPAQTQPPLFSFEHIAKDGPCSLDACDKDHKAALIDRLTQLSKLTWQQIQQASMHGQGTEQIARSSLKVQLPGFFNDDYVLAFRFFGKAPMLGFRRDRVFYILFLDPSFKASSH